MVLRANMESVLYHDVRDQPETQRITDIWVWPSLAAVFVLAAVVIYVVQANFFSTPVPTLPVSMPFATLRASTRIGDENGESDVLSARDRSDGHAHNAVPVANRSATETEETLAAPPSPSRSALV